MGDDGAGVLLEMVPSATPPHARNAPSSRPKGDGDKCKALPYAQLLSQVHPGGGRPARRALPAIARSPARPRPCTHETRSGCGSAHGDTPPSDPRTRSVAGQRARPPPGGRRTRPPHEAGRRRRPGSGRDGHRTSASTRTRAASCRAYPRPAPARRQAASNTQPARPAQAARHSSRKVPRITGNGTLRPTSRRNERILQPATPAIPAKFRCPIHIRNSPSTSANLIGSFPGLWDSGDTRGNPSG